MSEDTPRRELASRIGRLIGARVESYRRVEGGDTPALRLLCQTTGASFFAKIGTTPETIVQPDGAAREKVVFKYDSRGNWISKTYSSLSAAGGQRAEYRTITYF